MLPLSLSLEESGKHKIIELFRLEKTSNICQDQMLISSYADYQSHEGNTRNALTFALCGFKDTCMQKKNFKDMYITINCI